MKKPVHVSPSVLGFFASLLFALFGILLRGFPSDPDQLFTKTQELGVFATFVWFALCTISWGRFFLSWMRLRHFGLFGDLAVGSAFLAVLGFFLGALGYIHYSWTSGVFTLIQLGSVLLIGWERQHPSQDLKTSHSFRPIFQYRFNLQKALDGLGILCVLFVFLSRVLKASLAHGTSDPFLYHLLGPRLWADAGQIYLPWNLPIVFQSSWWEMLILLGQNILGGPAGGGLIEAHLFAQYLHVFFGLGGVLLGLFYLFRDIPYGMRWLAAACLGALLSEDLKANSWIAKNDWGVLLWSLAGTALLLTPQTKLKREAALGGGFIGLAIMAKLNSVFYLSFVLVVWLWSRCRNQKLFWSVAVSIAAGIVPMALRNGFATGNPFFPFFPQWTNPQLYSLPSQRANVQYPVLWHFSFQYWVHQFQWLFKDSFMHGSLLILPVFSFLFKNRTCRILALIAPLSIFWLMSSEVRNAFVRWGGASLIISGFLGVLLLAEFLHRLPFSTQLRQRIEMPILIIVLLFLVRATFVSEFWSLLDGPSPTYVIRQASIHMGGDSKAWLRLNASPLEPIFTTGDNQIYYISSFSVSPAQDDPRVSREIDDLHSASDLVATLTKFGFKYVLDTTHWNQRYWSVQAQILDAVVSDHPESIVYMGVNSQVIDLQILQESILNACRDWNSPLFVT